MAAKDQLVTYKEAALEFNTTAHVVGTVADRIGIDPKPVPRSGNAKGLDKDDMRKLRKILSPARAKSQPSPA